MVRPKDIAEGEGDLTNQLEMKSWDEMSEMAKWFTVFIEKTQTVIRDVGQNADLLRTSSGQLLARQMSTGAGQTSAKGTVDEIGAITKLVNEVNQIIDIIAGGVDEQAAATKEITNNISQVSTGIGEVKEAAAMSADSTLVNQSATALSGLAGKLNAMVNCFKV